MPVCHSIVVMVTDLLYFERSMTVYAMLLSNNGMLSEIHIIEKCYFLKRKIHSQII